MKTSNTQHPTPNIQWARRRPARVAFAWIIGGWMLSVGCWMLSAQPVPPPVIPSKKSAPVVPAVPVAPATPSVSAPSTGTVTPSAPSRPIISSDLGGRELSILQRANEHSGIMQRLAELGRTKANAEPVRVLADLLGTTEAKEHAQLLALTQAKGITLSEAVIPKKMQDRLVAAPKDAFDHAWLDEVSGLIKTAIQNYSSGSTSSDKDIKKFAADGLALAEQKLDVVKKVAAH